MVLLVMPYAWGADDFFTVRHLVTELSMKGEDAPASVKEARALAFEKGRLQAYQRLLEALIPDEEIDSLMILSGEDIQIFLREVEVRSEVSDGKTYRLVTDWHFDSDVVTSFLKQTNKSYISRPSFEMLLVPVWRAGVDMMADNPWRTAWRDFKPPSNVLSFELYHERGARLPQHWRELIEREAINYEGGILFVIAAQTFDEEGYVDILSLRSVFVGRQGNVNPILNNVTRDVVRLTGEGEKDFYGRAVHILYRALANRWKRGHRISHERELRLVQARISYDDLPQWLALRDQLAKISVIDDFNVETFGKKEAVISFIPLTPLADLRIALRGIGLGMVRENRTWVIKPYEEEAIAQKESNIQLFEEDFLQEDDRWLIYEGARQFIEEDDTRLADTLNRSQLVTEQEKDDDDDGFFFGLFEEEDE